MADWHPVRSAYPCEWLMRVSDFTQPYAIIRRIGFGDYNQPEYWFRVVTWMPSSEGRELIGWCRTLESAAEAADDWHAAAESFRHHIAANRLHERGEMPTRPPAAELLRVYRELKASRGGG